MKKAPLLYYQFLLLEKVFQSKSFPFHFQKLLWYMEPFLPHRNYTKIEEFKQDIILAGSSAYEALIDASEKANLDEVTSMLTDHNVPLLFRHVWIWSEDSSVMDRGKGWFTNKQEAKLEAKKMKPRVCTWDGPDAPELVLSVESICPCFIHNLDGLDPIAPKCLCYKSTIPQEFEEKDQINIDGFTVSRMASDTLVYTYYIQEAATSFNSFEHSIYLAYLQHKRHMFNFEHKKM